MAAREWLDNATIGCVERSSDHGWKGGAVIANEKLHGAAIAVGQEGAAAKTLDCGLLLELRARMKLLVDTQSSKWSYMFGKIEAELWKVVPAPAP